VLPACSEPAILRSRGRWELKRVVSSPSWKKKSSRAQSCVQSSRWTFHSLRSLWHWMRQAIAEIHQLERTNTFLQRTRLSQRSGTNGCQCTKVYIYVIVLYVMTGIGWESRLAIYLSVQGPRISTTWSVSAARPASEFLVTVFLRARPSCWILVGLFRAAEARPERDGLVSRIKYSVVDFKFVLVCKALSPALAKREFYHWYYLNRVREILTLLA